MKKFFLLVMMVIFSISSLFGMVMAYDLTPQDKILVNVMETHIETVYGDKTYKLSMIIAVLKMIANDETKSDRIRAICEELSKRLKTYQMGG